MRANCNLVTAVALVGSSLLYGNQIYLSVPDNKNSSRTSADVRSVTEGVQGQNQNTNQGTSPGGPGGGGTSPGGRSGPRRRAAMIATDASKVIVEIMSVPDKSIPVELLDKADAIAIFPGTLKGASIMSGSGRQGIISMRIDSGWGAPVFFNLSETDFGSEIGTQRSDYVLLIMNRESLNGLLKDKFEIGSGVSVAAGPVGRVASASTYPSLDTGILSYSRTKGTFSGTALKRAVISPDNELNKAIYQREGREQFFYSGRNSKLPAEVRIVPETLARYSRR